MTTTTFRAAYWISADRRCTVLLTEEGMHGLPNDQLMAAALDTACRIGLEIGDGAIEVGDYSA